MKNKSGPSKQPMFKNWIAQLVHDVTGLTHDGKITYIEEGLRLHFGRLNHLDETELIAEIKLQYLVLKNFQRDFEAGVLDPSMKTRFEALQIIPISN